MNGKHWHLEHADGSVWTQSELDFILSNLASFNHEKRECKRVVIDDYGKPYLIDADNRCWPAIPYKDHDLILVFDW